MGICNKMVHRKPKETIKEVSRMARVARLRPSEGSASRMTRSAVPVMAHKKVGVRAIPREPSNASPTRRLPSDLWNHKYPRAQSFGIPPGEILSWFADRVSIDLETLLLVEKATLLDALECFGSYVRRGVLAVEASGTVMEF